MKKTLKKSLAMLLSLMMIVSAFSVGSLAALAEENRVVLDECTAASTANWKSKDQLAWQGDAVNVWWPLQTVCTFPEAKDLTGIGKIFVDWTGSAQEGEFGGDSPFTTIFNRPLADNQNPDDYGIVLTSYTGTLPAVAALSDSEAYTDYGMRFTLPEEDVVAGENYFDVDYSTAGANFDITKVTGIAFVGRPGGQSTYFHALEAIIDGSGPSDQPSDREIVLSNCDSIDGWFTFDGDQILLDTEVKSEGSASVKCVHTGGVAWGTPLNHVDVTGLKSISFDITTNSTGILTEPTDKYLFLFSGGDPDSFVFQEVVNGENPILGDAELVSRIMQFDVSGFENYTLSGDGETFVTVTLTPSVIGENFDYTDITGFLHWSCSGYSGDHVERIDNIVATVANNEPAGEDEYISVKTWGVDQFNSAVEAGTADPEDYLVTSDKDLYTVFSRASVYGVNGCGMVGYASYENSILATRDHKYVYEFDVWVNGIDEEDREDILFYGDLYNHEAEDDATVNTYFTNGIKIDDFENETQIKYNETYGYKYKTLTDFLIAEESGNSEPRIYYNRLNVRNQGDRDSYAVGDINFYECRVYDETADPFHTAPVVTLRPGLDNMASFSSEVKPGNTNARELETLFASKCAIVTLPKAQDCDNTLLFGNASANLAAGKYSYTYSFSNIIDPQEGVVATIKIMKGDQEVATADIEASDIPEDGNVTVDFTAAEAGEYSAELYINNKMGFRLSSISLGVVLNQDDIAQVVEKINAIGEVVYDPDNELDNGAAVSEARAAYNALCEKYSGVDMSDKVENYELLTAAESNYSNLVEEYNTMIENAATVDEAIEAIPTPITLASEEAILLAEETLASFVDSFGEEKANLHITKIADLKEARRLLDELKIPGVIYGDVNGDGEVTVDDALVVLQGAVGKIQLSDAQKLAGDVDGEAGIGVSDALAVLQKAVGKVETLPLV